MASIVNFYLDDSGTRHPDRRPGRKAAHGYDWFSLGGILIKAEDELKARELHRRFCEKWNIDYPLHSVEIRGKSGNFRWLGELDEPTRDEFYQSLYDLMAEAPVFGLACVIDRPGYNHRYFKKYGRRRWDLCKTAFSILAERATKYATSLGYRLRILLEKCNKKEDGKLEEYYDALMGQGQPFSDKTSAKYTPIRAEEFKQTLYEFRLKEKTSPLSQLADLYLWPMCMGGYHATNRPYKKLLGDGKLLDCLYEKIEDARIYGIKYSCFDLVDRKT